MGIRFYCPNGHKLNVKTEQAGKVGFCPDCGVRVQIPLESTRPSSHKKHHDEDDNDPNQDNEILLTSKKGQGEVPFEETLSPLSVSENGANPSTSPETAESDVEPAAEPAVQPSVAHSVLDNDGAVWYVRGNDNQTYGPITNVVVKEWIAQRRIGPTMLVWRDGWPSWLEAKDVFPEIEKIFSPPASNVSENALPPIPPPPPTPPSTPPSQSASTSDDGIAALKRMTREEKADDRIQKVKLLKKKNKAVRDLILVVGLVVIIVILLAILIIILTGQKKPSGETAFRIDRKAAVRCLDPSVENDCLGPLAFSAEADPRA